jgi:hypothetical protein
MNIRRMLSRRRLRWQRSSEHDEDTAGSVAQRDVPVRLDMAASITVTVALLTLDDVALT